MHFFIRTQPQLLSPLPSTHAGPAPVVAAASSRLSDRRLGELFLRLLPGWLYYAPALLFPLVTVLAGLGAAYAPAAARWLSTQPLVMVRPGRAAVAEWAEVGESGWAATAVQSRRSLNPPPCCHRPPLRATLQGLGPLAPLLAAAGGSQPWATLLALYASLLTAQLGFVLEPVLDWLLGQDLRDPAEARWLGRG